jgi:methyltransferase (TIGR00027 family)
MKGLSSRTAGPLAAAAYYIINIILFPVTLIGYVLYVGYLYLFGRTPGVSTTAQGPLSARWAQHHLGVREDEAANRLMTAMPGFFAPGWYLLAWPLLFAHRLTGYVPKAFRYPFEGEIAEQVLAAARQTFFDAVVDRYLPNITQFVILGAGFDTRAYRLPKETQIRSFEVDVPKTQMVKRELLNKTGIDPIGVTFVSADFEKEDWLTRLVEAGFDPGKPALFLLEGVIIYLDREAVEDTLRKIASTATGSIVAFDYYTTESLESQALFWRFGRWATKAAGEPLKFGIDSTPPSRERAAELLQSCGLSLSEQRTLGQETEGKRAWGGFAIAIVK